ncbi:Uncharacterised protein [Salmonella enterica subsp. enterica serovar Bovismorbificans]|uniref:Uncharacterized protein n=1 Tax=Salmonella enterica subsp. enterica serovar Bovismorbificans TaxID=58097 RepID=A0A655BLF5_SALET|nr:Uncharacterised protein [Salmonella enterica subsp. enterica serovar Bovismorbificans]
MLNVIHLFRHHFNLIDSAVQRKGNAVTVVDYPAAWRNWHQLDTVFVRAGLVIGKTKDLQIIQIGDQYAGQQQNTQKGDQRPTHKQCGLSRIVTKRILSFHPLLNLLKTSRSLTVIRVVGCDAPRPVQTLRNQNPNQRVRER